MKIRKAVSALAVSVLACTGIVLSAPMAHAETASWIAGSTSCPTQLMLTWDANLSGSTITATNCAGAATTAVGSLVPYGWNDVISSFRSYSSQNQWAFQDENYLGAVFTIGSGVYIADLKSNPLGSGTWNDQITSFEAR